MLQSTSRRMQKIFISPFRPDTVISGEQILSHLGISVAVRPTDCALLVNDEMLFTSGDKMFSTKLLRWNATIKIVAKKTGKASICIIIERINNDSWSSCEAYNPYERLQVFAKEQPHQLPASTQKTYESMKEYKARMKAKRERETRK